MDFNIEGSLTGQTLVREAAGSKVYGLDIEDVQTSYAEESYQLTLLQRGTKRMFDILIALGGAVVFSPVILVIAIMIWLEDRHSPIFSQQRLGLGGKVFTIYKFRSMRIDSESDGVPRLCSDNDSRLTRVGEFIRNHHLDEFPQLWNVLKGDMSVVGPRPERAYFAEKIIEKFPAYQVLYRVRPGLFSFATLYNGYTETIDQMVRRAQMDLDYLKNYSYLTDLEIIYKTTCTIIGGKKF